MFSLSTIVTILAVLHASQAMPFSQLTEILPRDVTSIAVDEKTGEYVAYKSDGSLSGRYPINARISGSTPSKRAAPQCGNLSVDDLKKIPGWKALEQYANDSWGKGKREVVTNPEDYLDHPAQVCITDDIIELKFDADPVCQEHSTSTEGKIVGTTGEVTIEVDQGFNTASSYTVTRAATIGMESTLSVQVGIPEVAEVTSSLTIKAEVTNTLSSTFDVSYNDVSKVIIKMAAPQGQKCTAQATVKTCNVQATGQIRYLATGWVWFNYHKETKDHLKWAAKIDDVVTNIDDRSGFADFKGAMSSNTQAAYEGTCSP